VELSSGAIPLYFQIQQRLRGQIEAGDFAPGALLPTEAQLCETFGVSRITVGKALDALLAERLIVRRRGVGTFVAKQVASAKSVTLVGSLDEMLAPARDLRRMLLWSGVSNAPDFVVASLGLEPGARVACFEALFFSSNEPYSFSRQYMPAPVGDVLLNSTPRGGVPDIRALEAAAGARIIRAEQTITPVIADKVCAKHLGVKWRTPILEVLRTYFVDQERRIGSTIAWFHPTRYRYSVELLPNTGVRPPK
jgi:GntR family transcriptional regulator